MVDPEHILVSYATIVVVLFLIIAVTFLAVGWRISVALQTFVESQLQRAKTEEQVVSLFQEYIETNRQTQEQFWTALQVQADRLNRHLERKLLEGG